MDKRKELILFTLTKEHIRTGSPVSSGALAENYKLGISPATIRNEMAVLEDEGFIRQPHTSAGRVPTEAAYGLYAKQGEGKKIGESDRKNLDLSLKDLDEDGFKRTAKLLAALSGNAVFWAFYRRNIYYTGVSNLLKQPEFREIELIYDISAVIDRLDEIIDAHFDRIGPGAELMIGSQNPFGSFCSAILTKYERNGRTGLFGIIGPIRMDYARNQALVKYVREKITT